MKSYRFLIVLFLIVSLMFSVSCRTVKRCERCGRTEKEVELHEFRSKYYCSVHYREVVGKHTVPDVSKEIDRVLETTASSAKKPSETKSTMDYKPLYAYVHNHISTMGTMVETPMECDVTGDGYPDLCANVCTGSGIVTFFIVVYDVRNDKGYMLNDRMDYNYRIMGCSEKEVAVKRTVYGKGDSTAVYGTLLILGDDLVFEEA